MIYRRVMVSNLLIAVVRPLLYLLGMGLGVGGLVDRGASAEQALAGLTYFQFFGPSMIATTAMLVSVNDALWPVHGGFNWDRGFFAQAATPIAPGDIATGTSLWHLTKALLASAGVAVILALFPSTRSWGLVPAVGFGALTGLAFAAPITAWSAWRPDSLSFPNIQRFIIAPMFLFGGAFYPIDQLPSALQWFSRLTPVWHGVELCRAVAYGRLEAGPALSHVAYLAGWCLLGGWLSRRQFARRLGN